MNQDNEKEYFLERPGSIKKLWIMLYVVCGITLVPELFVKKESYFGIDLFFGFFAVLGFISCTVLILFAKVSGFILKKPENYYD